MSRSPASASFRPKQQLRTQNLGLPWVQRKRQDFLVSTCTRTSRSHCPRSDGECGQLCPGIQWRRAAELVQAGRIDTRNTGQGQVVSALGSEPEGVHSYWGAAPRFPKTIPTHVMREEHRRRPGRLWETHWDSVTLSLSSPSLAYRGEAALMNSSLTQCLLQSLPEHCFRPEPKACGKLVSEGCVCYSVFDILEVYK